MSLPDIDAPSDALRDEAARLARTWATANRTLAGQREADLVAWVLTHLADPSSSAGPLLDEVWETRHRAEVAG